MSEKKKIILWLVSAFCLLAAVGCSSVSPSDQETAEPFGKVEFTETPSAVTEETEIVLGEEEIPSAEAEDGTIAPALTEADFDMNMIPAYAGEPYIPMNGNIPFFTDTDLSGAAVSYEAYSELDDLGRCGVCVASVGTDIMPTEERGEIGDVKPSGWNQAKYPGVVDGNYLYNRCHLIGYQLTAENANEKNLITGTRYFNTEGMLPFENMVADYVKETGNHVLYRVTPVFDGNNPLASGVLIEAESVEDHGDGILFCVFCYNVQPGVTIDYSNGESKLEDGVYAADDSVDDAAVQQTSQPVAQEAQGSGGSYAVNPNNGKIHIVGGCAATGTGSNAMKSPVYFDTYEDAVNYSKQIAPGQEKRQCGNCW